MRRTKLELLKQLQLGPHTISKLAEELDKNQGWISELVSELETENLVYKNNEIRLAETYEARLLAQLADTYDITTLLSGQNESILRELHKNPATPTELETSGFAASTVYDALKKLRSIGAVARQEESTHQITDETLHDFLEATILETAGTRYQADDQTLIVTNRSDMDGRPTAFSAFQRYDIDYYPVKNYCYQGNEDLGIEEVLIHAVKTAGDRKQASMSAAFYLKHRSIIDNNVIWKHANTWNCVEDWADTLAYADQREVQQSDRFLPWEEFAQTAREYDIYFRDHHPEDSLTSGLNRLGETLDTHIDVYLLGGGNLILRGLKDSTKDLDLVVDDTDSLQVLGEALREQGYSERTNLEIAYEQLDPSTVFEKEAEPRYDIFVKTVAGKLQLTDGMKERVTDTRIYGNLQLHLLSLTDIFLFKSITEREGDFEDAALIARQNKVDWQQLLDEIKVQDNVTGQYFSFNVLDTLDRLQQRENIEPPIHQDLVSYCLENALRVSLTEPKTIHDLRNELDFPSHQIYNKLRKLEDTDEIKVDRKGKLNTYRRA